MRIIKQNNYLKTFLIGIIFASFMSVCAETTYTWYDGDKPRKVYLNSDYVADIQDIRGTRSDGKKAQRRVKFIRKSQLKKQKSGKDDSNQYPVFVEHPNSPKLMALPGNIIVKLNPDFSEEDVKAWAKKNDVELVEKLNIIGNVYVVASEPGLKCLELANSLRKADDVKYAIPNWQKQVEKK